MNPNLNVITLEEARRILEEIEEVERTVKHLESVSK